MEWPLHTARIVNLGTLNCDPPKNGQIALLLPTHSLMCNKIVSQKRNEAIDKPMVQYVTQFYILIRHNSILD